MEKPRKLQAMRVTFEGGRQLYFFGPADLNGTVTPPKSITSLDFSSEIEYDQNMSVDDLWLLAQRADIAH
jgi:hypothetical protein